MRALAVFQSVYDFGAESRLPEALKKHVNTPIPVPHLNEDRKTYLSYQV